MLTWSILDRGEPPEVARKCRGAFASVGPWESVGLGIFAHRRIEVSYERRLGLKEGRDLLIDDQAAGSVNRRYTRFLLRKNPSLTPAEKQRIKDAVGYPRADLIMHRGEQREFEEIKSDSSKGRTDGVKAVKDIERWLLGHGLSYARGTSYISGSQVYYLPILDTIILGTFPVDYGIRVSRMPLKSDAPGVWPQDGLLLYNFCIKADWKKLVWSKLAKLFGLLILLAIVLKREGKGLPGTLPPGTTLPVIPIKDPVRADLSKPVVTKMTWDPEVLETWESLTPHQLDDIEALFEIDGL
jgi:hypothetical protein